MNTPFQSFHIIDDGLVILRRGGVYRQCKVYQRGNRLYAGQGNGFIRLQGGGFTSQPDTHYEGIDLPPDYAARVFRGSTGEPLLKG